MTARGEKLRRRVIAQTAAAARTQANAVQFATTIGVHSWSEVLRELDDMVLEKLRKKSSRVKAFKSFYPEAWLVLQAGTMLRPPATPVEITQAELRLDVTLPPSYREFLLASNGLTLPAYCQFQKVQTINPYSIADPFGYELLEEYFGEIESPADSVYFAYDDRASSCEIRSDYAQSAIALNGGVPESLVASKEFGWILLVQAARFDDGEHEIWEHGSWHDQRYRSFAAYFENARRHVIESLD